ncbi:MAG: septum formation initiator family protein [Pseudomonadota bacterium]|nr:septum formation initiator family protein [Pseudomonadota bacterium]
MWYLITVLSGILLFLNVLLWKSDGHGLRQVRQLQAAVEAQRQENAALAERNNALAAEVRDLKEGLEAIEERARVELGMIRNGETFFRVLNAPASGQHNQTR